jgi:hypothetical protein
MFYFHPLRNSFAVSLLVAASSLGLVACSDSGGSRVGDGADAGNSGDSGNPNGDGLPAYAVSGSVSRTVEPGYGGDGRGTLYIALVKTCPTSTDDSDAEPVAAASVDNADLSSAGAPVAFTLNNVPAGSYQLNAFLDDVTSTTSTPDSPFPGKGDMVAFDGLSAQCTPVEVRDMDVQGVSFTLNMVMPIDIPGR